MNATTPSPRAMRRADSVLADELDGPSIFILGPVVILRLQDSIARALDAERQACIEQAERRVAQAVREERDQWIAYTQFVNKAHGWLVGMAATHGLLTPPEDVQKGKAMRAALGVEYVDGVLSDLRARGPQEGPTIPHAGTLITEAERQRISEDGP